jgi:hypothetical protein
MSISLPVEDELVSFVQEQQSSKQDWRSGGAWPQGTLLLGFDFNES